MDRTGGFAVDLLIREAWDLHRQARFGETLRAAESAVTAARGLGDLPREVRAVEVEVAALRMLGEEKAALARLTWMLTVVEDPARRGELAAADLTRQIAGAYMNWVGCARFLHEIPAVELFRVLDAGEAYLRAAGRPGWRAGLLWGRADVLKSLGRTEEALGPVREAVSLKERNPGAPGYTLATYRWSLGDLLRQLDRHDEAEGCYRAVLDDGESSPFDCCAAHEGLGWCALKRDDAPTARREAEAAVRLAEGMGDNLLCPPLELLVEACLKAGDLAAAQAAAERLLACACRVGGGWRPYLAHRDVAEVALAQGDAARARTHLDEAAPLARALDRQTGTTRETDELAGLRTRLAELDPAG